MSQNTTTISPRTAVNAVGMIENQGGRALTERGHPVTLHEGRLLAAEALATGQYVRVALHVENECYSEDGREYFYPGSAVAFVELDDLERLLRKMYDWRLASLQQRLGPGRNSAVDVATWYRWPHLRRMYDEAAKEGRADSEGFLGGYASALQRLISPKAPVEVSP